LITNKLLIGGLFSDRKYPRDQSDQQYSIHNDQQKIRKEEKEKPCRTLPRLNDPLEIPVNEIHRHEPEQNDKKYEEGL